MFFQLLRAKPVLIGVLTFSSCVNFEAKTRNPASISLLRLFSVLRALLIYELLDKSTVSPVPSDFLVPWKLIEALATSSNVCVNSMLDMITWPLN